MKKQPTKNIIKLNNQAKQKGININSHRQKKRKQKYGTSKLEADFAREFLDKLGVQYIYEYEAKDIGRFFDFAITVYDNVDFITENKHGIECIKQEGQNVPISFIIEIDGGYW